MTHFALWTDMKEIFYWCFRAKEKRQNNPTPVLRKELPQWYYMILRAGEVVVPQCGSPTASQVLGTLYQFSAADDRWDQSDCPWHEVPDWLDIRSFACGLNVLGGFLMLRCALFELNCLKAWDPWCRCSLNIYMTCFLVMLLVSPCLMFGMISFIWLGTKHGINIVIFQIKNLLISPIYSPL